MNGLNGKLMATSRAHVNPSVSRHHPLVLSDQRSSYEEEGANLSMDCSPFRGRAGSAGHQVTLFTRRAANGDRLDGRTPIVREPGPVLDTTGRERGLNRDRHDQRSPPSLIAPPPTFHPLRAFGSALDAVRWVPRDCPRHPMFEPIRFKHSSGREATGAELFSKTATQDAVYRVAVTAAHPAPPVAPEVTCRLIDVGAALADDLGHGG
jgi:hypothetical protein